MMNVTINPLEGTSIDNKKVNLGMSRAEVASILGKAECENGSRQLFFDGELAADYDGKDMVEFMELKNANHWATVGLGRVGYYK